MLNIFAAFNNKTPYSGQAADVTHERPIFPLVEPHDAEALNAFYSARGRLSARVAGQILEFQPSWQKDLQNIDEPWRLSLSLGEDPAELILPGAVLRMFAAKLDPDLELGDLSPAHRAILLEYALSDTLDAVEAALGCPVSLLTLDRESRYAHQKAWLTVAVSFETEGVGEGFGAVRMGASHLHRLAKGLDRLSIPTGTCLLLRQIPVIAYLRFGSVELTYSELRSLSPGDIVLLDYYCREPETVVLVIGEHLAARTRITPDGYQLLETPKPLRGTDLDWCSATSSTGGPLSACAPKYILLSVYVEAARLHMPYAMLGELEPGYLLPIVKDRYAPFDCMAAGTRIGNGTLTILGDRMGLRITTQSWRRM